MKKTLYILAIVCLLLFSMGTMTACQSDYDDVNVSAQEQIPDVVEKEPSVEQIILMDSLDFLGKTHDEIQSQYGEIVTGSSFNGGVTHHLKSQQGPVMFFADNNICWMIAVTSTEEVFSTPSVSFQELVDSLQGDISDAQIYYNEMDEYYVGGFNYEYQGQTYSFNIEDIGESGEIGSRNTVWINIPY